MITSLFHHRDFIRPLSKEGQSPERVHPPRIQSGAIQSLVRKDNQRERQPLQVINIDSPLELSLETKLVTPKFKCKPTSTGPTEKSSMWLSALSLQEVR